MIGIPLYNELEHFNLPLATTPCEVYRRSIERWGKGVTISVLIVNSEEPYLCVSKMGDRNWESN